MYALAVAGPYLISGTYEFTIQVWDRKTFQRVQARLSLPCVDGDVLSATDGHVRAGHACLVCPVDS